MDEGERFTEWIRVELAKQKKNWGDLAKYMGVATSSISYKVKGRTRWTLPDIAQACKLVGASYTIGERKKAKRVFYICEEVEEEMLLPRKGQRAAENVRRGGAKNEGKSGSKKTG